ncbi:MAG TPA: CocE/NonD family hydrolase [Usitatibacter sp.]|nr:CocE/NonD family hydrolase [Usitatibacter sp.]
MAASRPLERTLRAAHRPSTRWLAVALLALALPATAVGMREDVLRVPVVAGLEQAYIDVTVFRPPGEGPFPLLVLSHGSPRSAEDRRSAGRQRLAAQSERFVAMGFAVVVPTRRGYGESGGRWAEAYGTCAEPDYHAAGLETARDLKAAVDVVRGESWADASRIVLAGQSAGGFGSVAASATAFPGLVGVVNFAGGRGSTGPDQVCGEERLIEAMSRYGSAARVPELWIYSRNDRFFGPALARRMHDAFVAAGGVAEFVEAPPTGLDGHGYFARAMEDWTPRVEDFLTRIGAR